MVDWETLNEIVVAVTLIKETKNLLQWISGKIKELNKRRKAGKQ